MWGARAQSSPELERQIQSALGQSYFTRPGRRLRQVDGERMRWFESVPTIDVILRGVLWSSTVAQICGDPVMEYSRDTDLPSPTSPAAFRHYHVLKPFLVSISELSRVEAGLAYALSSASLSKMEEDRC